MIASQVDPSYTNDAYTVIPFVTAELIAEAPENADSEDYGLIAIHNHLGSNKSILIALERIAGIRTMRALSSNKEVNDEVPSWFANALSVSGGDSPRAVKNRFQTAKDSADFGLCMDIQVNVLVPKDLDINAGTTASKLTSMQYEILTGKSGTDFANTRHVMSVKEYAQNGHVVEAMMECGMMSFWDCEAFDMSYSLCQEVRWLGAQYLTKNTRGNFFPQITPILEDLARQAENAKMSEVNDQWGALSAFNLAIRK